MSFAESQTKALRIRGETAADYYVIAIIGIFYLAVAIFEFSIKTSYIRSMPQDLIFQLDGIYRLSVGQKIYTDFSAILGVLSYIIPLHFVHSTGDLVSSINSASGLLLVTAFPIVAYLTYTRLPPLFGLAFGIWVGLALMTRMNFGDDPTAVTMAMNYNRQGDAALALIMLMFRVPRTSGPTIALVDGLLYGLLAGFLLYTKVTFGLVALAFAPVIIWPQHHRVAVLSGFVVAFGLFVLAIEYGYGTRFQWIYPVRMALASSGPFSVTLSGDIHALLENLPEMLVCTLVPAWFLWRERRLTPVTVLFFIMVAGASVALITENGQHYFLFLPLILFFVAAPPVPWVRTDDLSVAAAGVRRARWRDGLDGLAVVTIAILAMESGPQIINLAYVGYRSVALPPMVANDPVLGRIVISPENYEDGSDPTIKRITDGQTSVLDAFTTGRFLKPLHPFDNLTMVEYRDYLTDGMRAAREGCDPGSRILTLDNANPFPLLLGWPPGGTMLVIHPDRILSKQARPSDAEMFRDINCVLVPKLPVRVAARDFMFDVFGSYMANKFSASYETKLWKVLKLKSPAT